MRPIDVIAPHDNDGQLEALLVRLHQHLGGRLARGVRVRRRQYARLEQVRVLVVDLAVDLVGRDVDEALDADLLGALEQHVGAVDVGVREAVRVAKAQVDVRLRGKVEDGIDVVALEAVHHLGRVRYVALVEGEVAPLVEDARVVERRAVVELVKGHDVVRVRVRQGQVSHEPAGAAELEVRDNSQAMTIMLGSCPSLRQSLHEAGAARDHDILDVW